jgi:hypothetical protein
MSDRNPVLDVPLMNIMRWEIAQPLQQMLHLYNVGNFLAAWGNPENHKCIEQVFDSPQQAHHAAAVCAAWLGVKIAVGHDPNLGWWWPADGGSAEHA